MLIPRFSLSQDPKTLTIKLLARYCKLGDLEVEVEENCFLFSCCPYYLRLSLPGRIVDNDNTKSSYDTDTGEFTFTFDKVIPGEEFEDLAYITKFLVKKVDASYGFEDENEKIVVLSGDTVEEDIGEVKDCLTFGFGFALQGGAYFKSIHTEYFDVFNVDPFKQSLEERRKLRLKYEVLKFDKDYYLGDLLEPDDIEGIIQQVPPWKTHTSSAHFTNKELDFLKDLPNKDYKLSEIQTNYVFNSLIDILYAYCYNQRVNEYEENSESGWNIATLSASLSWLDVFETPRETLVFAFRRSLIYPLYRNFNLSLKVLDDLHQLLHLGEEYILKCLIEIYYIFLNGDSCRYILNNLFIKDYIIYVMKWDKSKWLEYLESLYKVTIKKDELGLNLREIEEDIVLIQQMMNLDVKDDENDSTDSEDSSDEDGDSSGVETDTSDESGNETSK
ncbi:hypothetical protein NQ315_010215 [Exocentrus adspersus]|uniref:Protein SHQ1 homolog n=1 Tax=Exocentrus adspersus TaxID=1586481 RepID=A0AAV8WAJ2_9CUCU|nr:hypothetical protein NQ315_010215 [Exocentrus adspersus]